jgi:hypothetical protein
LGDEENHRIFLRSLDESGSAVWRVARWIHSQGMHVKINAAGRAPRREDWRDFSDCGDLEVCLRVEVKQLSREFRDRETWPFGDKFIACSKGSWDRAFPKPWVYIYLSADGIHYAKLSGATRDRWTVDTRRDSRHEDVVQQFYFAPIELVTWGSLEDQ